MTTPEETTMTDLHTKAKLFRSLHEGGPLVLPNAWDAGSAVLAVRAGAAAVATTSAGVAWSYGRRDGQQLSREAMLEVVSRIAAAVDVPVTADVEGGYGAAPDDVAATVSAAVGAGAVGVNVEDSRAPGGPLFAVDEQAARLRAAREAAGDVDLFLNARTDVVLFGIGDPDGRLDEVRRRAAAYAEAGADCLFVPGLLDPAALAELVRTSPLPLNAMALPGGPAVADLVDAGVTRVSVGPAIAVAAYSLALRAAREVLGTGTYGSLDGSLGIVELDEMFGS
jgi:2-methylisocitrate lyase-like PEP mutase family enzyme